MQRFTLQIVFIVAAGLCLHSAARRGRRGPTVVGMLATTNDGFFASQGIRLPSAKTESVDALVYDAGSEAN